MARLARERRVTKTSWTARRSAAAFVPEPARVPAHFASLMIASGVNAKALSTFMGHATVAITLDRYGHLMPGSEAEAAGLLDTYLGVQREAADELARAAGGCLTGERTGEQELTEPEKPL